MAKKKPRSNMKLLLLLLLLIPIGLVTYFVFIDEPTQYQIQADDPITPMNEEIVIELPPIEEVFDLAVPIPTFEPLQVAITPVITTTNDLGVSVTTRGDRTFLQDITGLDITISGQPDVTYNMGTINIDMEVDTGLLPPDEFGVSGALARSCWASHILRNGEMLNTASQFAVPNPTFGIGSFGCANYVIGGASPTELVNIFDNSQIGEIIIDSGATTLEFILERFSVSLNVEDPITLAFDPLTFTQFNLTNSIKVYEASFQNNPIIIINETIPENATEIIVEEVVMEDLPFNPCPDVLFDSISFLFPTNEISGTTALWDKTPVDFFDIINIDVRNNRNCDLDIAIGSKWRAVTGQLFVSEIAQINIITNQTIPFRSIAFDADMDCAGTSCSGQEIQWCFFGQVSTTDPVEIINEFCGKKFFR